MIRNRTGYSFRSAIGDIGESHKKITDINEGFSVVTDTASLFSHTKWTKLCKKANSTPVFGIELAVSSSINRKKPDFDYWTFIAKDSLKSIHELFNMATSQFRFVPVLTYDQANKAQGVFKIAGRNVVPSMVADDVWIGLSPSLNKAQYKAFSPERFVAMSDNRYIDEGDRELYSIQLGRDASLQTYPQHLLTRNEWIERMQWVGDESLRFAQDNSRFIMNGSKAVQVQGTMFSPERKRTLLEMCIEGWERVGLPKDDEVYQQRMLRELKLIEEKRFEDYFYIIADVCQWARKRMAVGPARGSSSGSLVCYLLNITTVDPIKYGLIFERFIDVNRDDLPDIDIDFSDVKRQLVFDYMAERYGKEKVVRLGAVSMFKPKSILVTAGGALDIPKWKLDKVADSIILRSGGDSRAKQTTEDTFKDTLAGKELLKEHPELSIMFKMEGQPKNYSQHAAGIVITEIETSQIVGVDARTGAAQCDKYDAEALGLLKIDALGLTQLSVFEDCLEAIGKDMSFLDKLEPNDQKAFDVLNQGKFSGIAQFNGLALQYIAQQIDINSFQDIVAITALARPGPLSAGGTNQWIKVRTGKEPERIIHPEISKHLSETLGVVAYQEQVMNIGREVGGLSWGDVTALRKAMSKSLGKEYFDQFGDRWKAGASSKGIPKETLDSVWTDLCAYGSWAFNKSHAVAYGLVSYYCCWLKAYHPVEFAAATLNHLRTVDDQIAVLRELDAEGIGYVAIDIEKSTDKWVSSEIDGNKVVVGPLTMVRGLGPKILSSIMSSRARNEPLSSRAQKLLANPKTDIDSLWPIRVRVKELVPNLAEKNIFTPPTRIIDCQANGLDQEVLVICCIAEIKPKDENEEVNIAKRGYVLKGESRAINLRLADDTGTIFAKVSYKVYDPLGIQIVERGRAGNALYAIKGRIPKDFRMISVQKIRYLGDMKK